MLVFTYDGLKKVKCFIEEGKVVINGDHYAIFSCNDITSSTARAPYAMAVLILVTLLAESFICFQSYRSGNYREFIAILTLTCLVTALLSWSFIVTYDLRKKCRTIWRVNYKNCIYIEFTDDVDTEGKLLSILNSLRPNVKVDYKIIAGLVILPFASFAIMISLLFLTEGTKYARPALILFCVFIVAAGVYNIYGYYQKLKWK
jgi:uncharacterized membrane protein YeiB